MNRFIAVSLCVLTFAFPAALIGCPKPSDDNGGIPPGNVLDIPPLGTRFEYTGEDLDWNLADHPRILANPEGIRQLRDNPEGELAQELIGAAQAFRDLAASDPAFSEPTAPLTWAWGYILTEDETYLRLVRGSLDALLQFPPIVKAPEGANIPFLYQASALGGVYDLLYDDFTVEERERIEKVLRETVFHTLAYKVTEYSPDINFWAHDPDANYFVTFYSMAGLVAIDLIGVEPDAEDLAEHCWSMLRESLNIFDTTNGWREGLTYLDFCWGQFACYFLLALERNTDLRPYDEPWFGKSVGWAIWGALPDRATIACFGDNEPENYSVASWLYRVGALTGEEWYFDEAEATAAAIADSDAPDEMRHLALDLPVFEALCVGREPTGLRHSVEEYTGLDTVYFPGLEWGFIRTPPAGAADWSEDDFYCAFKSGAAGYDHNHLDQGSLILAAYSEVLLSDPGRGGPDIIRQDPHINCLFEAGLGHNTLIVGDGCYEDLGLFPDNPTYFARPGAFTSEEITDEYIQYTTDNSGLYPTEPLGEYRRTFLYIRPGIVDGADAGVLILADRVDFREEKGHSFLFHTPGEVEMTGDGIARLINGDARLDYYGFCTIPTVDKTERQETTWDIRDSTCYYRSTAAPSTGSDWVHVLIPCRTDGPETPRPEITMHMHGIEVVWDDYSLMLMVERDKGWVVSQPGE